MKIATAVVIEKGSQVLIALRGKDGFWEFPGGRIDPGETPEQCAVREIKEELNLDVRLTRLIGVVKGFYRYDNMVVHVFAATVDDDRGLMLDVHREVKWVLKSDLKQYNLIDEDRPVLSMI